MTTIEQLVGQFIDDWNAGRRPDVLAFLERAAPQDRDALASQLETWLDLAPTPAYDEPTRQAIASEPALIAALDAAAVLREPLADRLPTLRQRAGLAIRDVAARLTQLLDLDDEPRTVAYLEQIERDELDERRLSRRLLDVLSRAALAPAPATPMDELDRLFLGGPDA